MSTEAEIRIKGMQALIGALGLVDAERLMAATSRDRCNYTEWRRLGLPAMSLDELAAVANQMSATLPIHLGSVGYPFIQTGDVVRAVASKVPYTQTLNEEGLAVSKLFQPPLVLITIAANISDTAVLDYPACFTDSVVGLIPGNGVDARFLELMMRAQKQHLNDIAPQMAQKNINIEILKPIKVPVPPLAEQKRFVVTIEKLEQTIAQAQAILAAAPAKKQAVMQRYL